MASPLIFREPCLLDLAGWPIQSFLFAKIVTTFQLTGRALIKGSEHWALMFFILAIGIGIMYFVLGWLANTLSMVRTCLKCFDLYS
jgi:hypothetical protein